MDHLNQENIRASLPNVPYDQRWDHLRPVIEHLYVEEGRKLSDISTMIKHQYGFNAG